MFFVYDLSFEQNIISLSSLLDINLLKCSQPLCVFKVVYDV